MVGESPWESFAPLARKYGDVMYLQVLGQHTVILSSYEATSDLLVKRHAIYSDRSYSTMLNDIMGLDWLFLLWNNGEKLRNARKYFNSYFSVNATEKYVSVIPDKTVSFLNRLRNDPERFLRHSRYVIAAIVIKMTYGIDIADTSDPIVADTEEFLVGFKAAGQPGRFYVDVLPILKYIPSWFPGAGFKRLAAKWREYGERGLRQSFEKAKSSMAAGEITPCIAVSMLEECGKATKSSDRQTLEAMARDCCGIAYPAGIDSSTSTLQVFFLAMAMYPEAQKRAQKHVDAVLGQERLALPEDRPSLPYVDALIREVLRWKPSVPLAVPHQTSQDDVYRGYFIPKGTTVIANAWDMLHDPEEYPDPEAFKPERFLRPDGTLNTDKRDPTDIIFGFGRRVCPGEAFAWRSLFTIITSILQTFDIEPALDETGQPEKLEGNMIPGLISHPVPFKCRLKLRSANAEALLLQASGDA
ncbi:cytochrome P450 [Panus rudis PR-1116 ss-1]|nr:cytochrome P450 [Panus rudis PR-1116 ss-1]